MYGIKSFKRLIYCWGILILENRNILDYTGTPFFPLM